MKKLLLPILVIMLAAAPAFCRVKIIYEQDDIAPQDEEICVQETTVKSNEILQGDGEQTEDFSENEAKIIKDNAIYFDMDNYDKNKLTGNIFHLQIEQNDELLQHKTETDYIKVITDYTATDIGHSKFNNKTTISSQTMSKNGIILPNLFLGYGAAIKEYMPLPDTTNFSTLSTSLYADYKFKYFVLEGELEQTKNVAADSSMNYISFGPKINITKSAAIKTSLTKEFGSDNIYGELAFIYKPVKSKRDAYFEINAWSSNTQYNIPQQRLQIYGKIKI